MHNEKRIRVLIAKPGLDGHDQGARVVASALRDAGMEVIYTGLFQTPEQIVKIAMEENVDVIGLSMLSGAHDVIVPRVMELLEKNGMKGEVIVIAGGVIPPFDVPFLKEKGVKEVFGPGTSTDEIVKFIQRETAQKKAS